MGKHRERKSNISTSPSFCLRFLILLGALFLALDSEAAEDVIKVTDTERTAAGVIKRTFGRELAGITFQEIPAVDKRDVYEIEAKNGKVIVRGSSPVALSRGVYQYLRDNNLGMMGWAGTRLDVPKTWPNMAKTRCVTPYQHRYYFNPCVFGYTTAYWDWQRWEKEIDWMALHGINFPMALVANEAISTRIWKKIGFTQDEIDEHYTGPAHLPWQRMGCVNNHDGSLPDEWHKGQVKLQHKILKRMKELQINPVVPAFAGFVPKGITRVYPDIKLLEMNWGGFLKKHQSYLLAPGNPLFHKIGKLYIEEWEKEFGKCTYYLADSFNEMDLPKIDKPVTELLADYGSAIYQSLKAGNPDAVWVVQGWMFGYQRHIWNKETVNAFFSKIPDDKMVILDYSNEYNGIFWRNGMNYDVFEGYNNKPWIYGFVANSGGNTGYTGVFDFYAANSIKALNSPNKKRLSGFGISPEGIENNEVTFELITDMAWRTEAIDLGTWFIDYSKARYGACPEAMAEAWQLLRRTCYGSMSDHPRFGWQISGQWYHGTVSKDPRVLEAIGKFLSCADELKESPLYRADAIEMAAVALSLKAEDWFTLTYNAHQEGQSDFRDKAGARALQLLTDADRLLESHPTHRMDRWIDFARANSNDPKQQDTYEANARRLITVWGPANFPSGVNDYAARMWSGLIRDFYRPRMALQLKSFQTGKPFDRIAWEEAWIRKTGLSKVKPFTNPVDAAKRLVSAACDKPMPTIPQPEGEVIGGWIPGEVSMEWKTMEWPINTELLGKIKGVYFKYTHGHHRLDMRDVVIVADGKVVAEDNHYGYTGTPSLNPNYLYMNDYNRGWNTKILTDNFDIEKGQEYYNIIDPGDKPVYTLKVPEGTRANNGAMLRASVCSPAVGSNSNGQIILLLEDEE